MCVHPQTDHRPERAARGGGHLIDLADYAQDPTTLDLHELIRLIATWDPELRDEVHQTLGDLAIICATRGAVEHHSAAELLSLVRRLIQSTGVHADSTLDVTAVS